MNFVSEELHNGKEEEGKKAGSDVGKLKPP
jgi:hypothetical protein